VLPEPDPEQKKDLWNFHDETSSMGFTASQRRAALRNNVGYLVAESTAEEHMKYSSVGKY
jgi:hypothetical protein